MDPELGLLHSLEEVQHHAHLERLMKKKSQCKPTKSSSMCLVKPSPDMSLCLVGRMTEEGTRKNTWNFQLINLSNGKVRDKFVESFTERRDDPTTRVRWKDPSVMGWNSIGNMVAISIPHKCLMFSSVAKKSDISDESQRRHYSGIDIQGCRDISFIGQSFFYFDHRGLNEYRLRMEPVAFSAMGGILGGSLRCFKSVLSGQIYFMPVKQGYHRGPKNPLCFAQIKQDSVKIWDVQSKKQECQVKSAGLSVNCTVCFSPSGLRIGVVHSLFEPQSFLVYRRNPGRKTTLNEESLEFSLSWDFGLRSIEFWTDEMIVLCRLTDRKCSRIEFVKLEDQTPVMNIDIHGVVSRVQPIHPAGLILHRSDGGLTMFKGKILSFIDFSKVILRWVRESGIEMFVKDLVREFYGFV